MDYVSPAGTNQIKKWSKRLSIQQREDFETLLSFLSKQQAWEWPHFRMLSGKKYKGIGEIRFKSRVQLRVAGIKSKHPGRYILLIGFSHKQNVYDPPNAPDTAVDRKGDLERGEASTCEHEEDDGETEQEQGA